jgi:D-alanine-D-alanine ligase
VRRVEDEVGWPAVVLPVREGSSVGVTLVEEPDQLGAALEAAFAWDLNALVEEQLTGLEFSIILVGNDDPIAFLPTEVVTGHAIMSYEDKYMPGRSQKITPARVDAPTLERIQSEAIRLYRAFGFRGYARLDGFLTGDGRLVFNDPNSTSGMAPSSFIFHQAAEAGFTPVQLVDHLIELAFDAHAGKKGPL